MELPDELLIEISYVQISNYRTKTMNTLNGNVKIPSGIARDTGIRLEHISRVLSELKSHKLVECINPEVRKGRLYKLTERGDDVVKHLK